jgi:hypothetical protein
MRGAAKKARSLPEQTECLCGVISSSRDRCVRFASPERPRKFELFGFVMIMVAQRLINSWIE